MFGNVIFFAEEEADIDRFIREYVVAAIERVDETEVCAGLSFDRDEPLNPDGESVVLTVLSDFETFVEQERDRWRTYRDAGVIESWETHPITHEQAAQRFGEQGVDRARRLWSVAGKMGRLAYEEFDGEFPPAVSDEDDATSVGWWIVPHHVTVGNLGYSPREEIQMIDAILKEDLRLIADREGTEAVDEEIDTLIESLETVRDEVTDDSTPRDPDA